MFFNFFLSNSSNFGDIVYIRPIFGNLPSFKFISTSQSLWSGNLVAFSKSNIDLNSEYKSGHVSGKLEFIFICSSFLIIWLICASNISLLFSFSHRLITPTFQSIFESLLGLKQMFDVA